MRARSNTSNISHAVGSAAAPPARRSKGKRAPQSASSIRTRGTPTSILYTPRRSVQARNWWRGPPAAAATPHHSLGGSSPKSPWRWTSRNRSARSHTGAGSVRHGQRSGAGWRVHRGAEEGGVDPRAERPQPRPATPCNRAAGATGTGRKTQSTSSNTHD